MKRRSLLSVCLLPLLALFLTVPGWTADQSPGVTADTILIGVIGPMTGPASWSGLSVQNGSILYFDEVNESGGVNGRKIKTIVEDDKCLPTDGVAATKKLLDRDNVFALFGGVCSNATLAALPLIKDSGTPFMDVLVSHPSLTSPVIKNVFRIGSIPSDIHAYYMVDFAVQHFKAKKLAIANQSDEYGKYGAQYLEEWMGKKYQTKPVAHEVDNLGDVDFTSQVMRLKNAAPDVVLLYGFPKESSILLRQSKELGLNAQWIGSSSLADRSFTVLVGEPGVGSVAIWTWEPYLETDNQPLVNQFKDKFEKKYPGHPVGKPNALDMAAYAAAKVLVEGLTRAGRELTTQNFIKSLESVQNYDSGLMGKITFTPTDHQGNKTARFVLNEAGGKRVLIGPTLGE